MVRTSLAGPTSVQTASDLRPEGSSVADDRAAMHFDFADLLLEVLQKKASDLHITAGSHPMVRVRGRLVALEDYPTLTPTDTREVIYSILTNDQRQRLETDWQLDFAYAIPNVARFRVNAYMQRSAIGAAFRLIPFEIRSIDELALPTVIHDFVHKPRGLVLVTGPTGSGKSTSLAAVIDAINRTREDHILTIEDPIEFLHPHKKCIVNQRELGTDAKSFAFATLHTQGAAETIDRIIDVFSPEQQQQVRVQLSVALQGVVTQTLLPTSDGSGRIAACEVLIPTAAVRNLSREGKTHQIMSVMQTGSQSGMQTMDAALATLARQGKISSKLAEA